MIYSRAAQHAIRALTYLATIPAGIHVPVREIAGAAGVPLPFLSKIMQSLTRRGLITSQKGPGGGVALGRRASQITLEEIVIAIDGSEFTTGCVLGLPKCGDESPCPAHDAWKVLRETLRRQLHRLTLGELAPAWERKSRGSRRRAARAKP